MSAELFPVPEEFARRAWVDGTAYRRDYARSLMSAVPSMV